MAINIENMKVEKTNGVATVTVEDENIFYNGTDIPKKTFKEVFDHTSGYIQNMTEAASEESTKIMKEDKDITEVVFVAPYGVSKRGNFTAKAKREVTFRGMNGGADVTRSDLRVAVKDPLTTMSKSKLKDLQKQMTDSLLG